MLIVAVYVTLFPPFRCFHDVCMVSLSQLKVKQEFSEISATKTTRNLITQRCKESKYQKDEQVIPKNCNASSAHLLQSYFEKVLSMSYVSTQSGMAAHV